MAKVDHSLSDNDKLTGRYFFNGGPTRNSSVFAIRRRFEDRRRQSASIMCTEVGRARSAPLLVNDLRFTYIRSSFHSISAGLGGDYPSKIGLKGVPDNAFPQFAPAGFHDSRDECAGAAAVSDRAAAGRRQHHENRRRTHS